MEIEKKPKIVVIVGPTGSGKTALSIALGKAFSGEVINADSRQVYRGLDIGTEKITKAEMENIPHHLIDIIDPSEAYSAFDFKRDATKAVEEITARGHLPIIAGGTFFYVDTLLGKSVGAPAPQNPTLRAQLEEMSTKELYALLEAKDQRRSKTIEKDNKRRLVRALEVIDVLGVVPEVRTLECPYDVLMIGIRVDREKHREVLKVRGKKALEHGLIEELEKLLKHGASESRLSEIGLEYKEALSYLHGEITYERLLERFTEVNWQYAKRQLLWLKRYDEAVWFDAPVNAEEIKTTVAHFLKT
jgi:tRNA dimethylallyltransferase